MIIMKKICLTIFSFTLLSLSLFAQKKNTYAVVVSFNSTCCGVPDNQPLLKLVSSFRRQNKIKNISIDSIGPMGREGEYYLAFHLTELNKDQKIKFIQKLKKLVPALKDKGSAEIKENLVINKSDLSSGSTISTFKL